MENTHTYATIMKLINNPRIALIVEAARSSDNVKAMAVAA